VSVVSVFFSCVIRVLCVFCVMVCFASCYVFSIVIFFVCYICTYSNKNFQIKESVHLLEKNDYLITKMYGTTSIKCRKDVT
jgi:hypothetical protein